MCAVVLLFFDTLWPVGRQKTRAERQRVLSLWGKILVATLPAAVLGLLLDDYIDKTLFNPQTVAVSLIFYGVLFLLAERRDRVPRVTDVTDVTYKNALAIGAFQVLALIPGTSRSGATILLPSRSVNS